MTEADRTLLAQILTNLNEIGSRLDAIDRGQGDRIAHWQEIGVIDHRVRRLANTLEEDTLFHLPALAAFTLSEAQLFTCWANCATEIEALNGHS